MATSHRVSHTSLAVAAFSTVVEWYDFTLYLYFSTVLARVFFGGGEAALVTTLMGFALAYLMRPVGAAVFGHIGDRHGRRPMLLISMAVMSLAMLLTALLPTYGQVGIAAAWLLFGLRCVMGFSVGGEYTGVIAYLLEGADPRRRGLIASLAAASSEVGALLAVGVAALTVSLTSEAQLASWGWRVPFLVGAALAGGVWFARQSMEESPDWLELHANEALHANPIRHAITRQRSALLRAFAISALGSITFYVGITYVPAFLETTGTLGEERALWLSTAAAVAVILVTPLVGLLADRFGRKPALVVIAVLSAVLPISLFTLMAGGTVNEALAGALVLALVAGGMSAVGAIACGEQFSEESRASGLGLGYTLATAVFGGLTPWMAQLLVERTGAPQVPGIMIAVVAVAALPVFVTMRETAPAHAA
ncbi:MFS transporter [Altererythrobacter salegens]|uniref:MFS transporter n=1 Tax=Croceibacterium salegens TaxID=1737568 RepID=A0A6I4T0N8_9SPHN|nr:MFS transporter [Croceibacterium salegens]MXO60817.1 MFS transporter [Croceibacterium salegens]